MCIACCRNQQNVYITWHKDTQVSEGNISFYETLAIEDNMLKSMF